MNEVENSSGKVEETYESEITVTEVESDSEEGEPAAEEEEPATESEEEEEPAATESEEEEEPAAAPAEKEEEPAAADPAEKEEEEEEEPSAPAEKEEEPAAVAEKEEEEEPAAPAVADEKEEEEEEEEPSAPAEKEEEPDAPAATAAEEEEPAAEETVSSNQKISEFQYLVEILGDWATGSISRSKFVSLWETRDVVVNESVDYDSLLPDFGKIPKLMLEWNKNTNFDKTNFKNLKLYTSSSNMLADETVLENKLVKLDKIRDIILDCANFNYKGRRKQLETDITELF